MASVLEMWTRVNVGIKHFAGLNEGENAIASSLVFASKEKPEFALRVSLGSVA